MSFYCIGAHGSVREREMTQHRRAHALLKSDGGPALARLHMPRGQPVLFSSICTKTTDVKNKEAQ